MSIESSAKVYIELEKMLGPKARKSLINLKAACDRIVTTRGEMNYSVVARVATECFGGPKIQTVQNNKNLKRYIGARILEYHQENRNHNIPKAKGKAKETINNVYPADNLDTRTKTYIDQLHTRLELAETRYRNMRKQQENITRANPICLAEAIGKGPTDSGAMQLEHRPQDSEELFILREGVRALLDLYNYIDTLIIEEKENRKSLALMRPAGIHVVLDPAHFEAIDTFLKEPCNE
jgi:hypothetical protein